MNELEKPDFSAAISAAEVSLGVKETTELVKFLAALGNATDTALENGKVDIFDITLFLGLIPGVAPALNGIKEVPAEIGDLDNTERGFIVQELERTLFLRNFVTEQLVEKGFDLALHFAEYVALIRAAKQQKKLGTQA
jgi:hypothetical protein